MSFRGGTARPSPRFIRSVSIHLEFSDGTALDVEGEGPWDMEIVNDMEGTIESLVLATAPGNEGVDVQVFVSTPERKALPKPEVPR